MGKVEKSLREREIRITNVPAQTREHLKNIAKYYGCDVGAFLKLKIGDIVKNTPDHIKNFKHLDEVS